MTESPINNGVAEALINKAVAHSIGAQKLTHELGQRLNEEDRTLLSSILTELYSFTRLSAELTPEDRAEVNKRIEEQQDG